MKKVLIIGAGPAGLTAAYQLSKRECPVLVFERDAKLVGGISRTGEYKGFHFDIGGHRFFSKSKIIEDLWTEILPHDMLDRPRSSRIYYKNKFYSYPLKAFEAFRNLGLWETSLSVLSYFRAKIFPKKNPRSLEDWVTNQFGYRLYRTFFKTYTEKVWGMSCKDISADWAAQRIKGLSFFTAVKNALIKSKPKSKSDVIKTLIDSFRYPRKGPGMLWEECARKVRALGGVIQMGAKVEGLSWDSTSATWTLNVRLENGGLETHVGTDLISSAPLREIALALSRNLTENALIAARSLKYRDFITVVVILKEKYPLGDNWIYIHDPGVKVGRIQNFKSWSPEMVPDPKFSCLGLEYFCFEGDGLWNETDSNLLAMAAQELKILGLASPEEILDGCIVRQEKAYPVYDDGYQRHVDVLKNELENKFPTLHLVGRNGMHKYNNQDHAMMTAILTAENIISGKREYDVWAVNQDAEYHESGSAGYQSQGTSGLRFVPTKISSEENVRDARL